MYKKHKIQIWVFSLIVGILSGILNLQYHIIASDVTSFISIAIAVYMAALALPLSKEVSDYMKRADKEIKHKTCMGVLCEYLQKGIMIGFSGIIVGCITTLLENKTIIDSNGELHMRYPELYRFVSSLGFALFSANIILGWIVFKYLKATVLNGNNLQR